MKMSFVRDFFVMKMLVQVDKDARYGHLKASTLGLPLDTQKIKGHQEAYLRLAW